MITHRLPSSRTPVLLLGLGLIAAGLGAIGLTHATVGGFVLLIPGGLLVLSGSRGAEDPVEAIVIDDFGVSDRTIDLGPIPWDQVIRARVERIRSLPVLALEVVNPDAWLARMPPRHQLLVSLGTRELGLPQIFLHVIRLDTSPEEIVAAINQRARGQATTI